MTAIRSRTHSFVAGAVDRGTMPCSATVVVRSAERVIPDAKIPSGGSIRLDGTIKTGRRRTEERPVPALRNWVSGNTSDKW